MVPGSGMGEVVFAVLFGAFGPLRGVDRWFLRLPWWQKAISRFAVTALAVFGGSLA